MGTKEMRTTLPEVLVERILAMVPYPNIFKARVLSKSWLARLSSVSSHNGDVEKKSLAVAFQKIVGDYSSKWMTFSPVFVGDEDLIAYEESSQHWQSLPQNHLLKSMPSEIEHIRGALSLISTSCVDLYVVNVLTRNWKLLPSLPQQDEVPYDRMLVIDTETYKVVELDTGLDFYLAQIYDSQSDSWSSKRFDLSDDLGILRSSGEYLDGVLYWVWCSPMEMAPSLLALNAKESTFELLHMVPLDIQFNFWYNLFDLVVCNGSLLMIIYDAEHGELELVIVVKADLGSRRWLQLSEGPPNALKFRKLRKGPISNGNCIYHVGEDLNKVLAYNVQKNEWSSFPIPPVVRRRNFEGSEEYLPDAFSFQPGLNPFIGV